MKTSSIPLQDLEGYWTTQSKKVTKQLALPWKNTEVKGKGKKLLELPWKNVEVKGKKQLALPWKNVEVKGKKPLELPWHPFILDKKTTTKPPAKRKSTRKRKEPNRLSY